MMIKIANMMKRLRKDEKGFTLIELMVVIAVLGIMAALIIPQFSNVSDKAKASNADSAAAAIAAAAAMAYSQDTALTDANIEAEIPTYMNNYDTSYGADADYAITFVGGKVHVVYDGIPCTKDVAYK